MKKLNMDVKTEKREGKATVTVFRDFTDIPLNPSRDLDDIEFVINEGVRISVGMDEASGYALQLRLEANGPLNHIQIRNISGVFELGETD